MSEPDLDALEAKKREILEKQERLGPESAFEFSCHPGVSCFNRCCRDVNIVLTPYDILRMKRALGMTSTEFLERHTVTPFTKEMKFPIVFLKMEENEEKTCPFVGPAGCTIYENRPWPCRMYPIGLASPKDASPAGPEGFYFLLAEEHCKGHAEAKRRWTVLEWLDDQGVAEYERMSAGFKHITLHDFFVAGGNLPPEKMEMFYMAFYDIDRFRRFIFGSSFLERFDVPAETLQAIRDDDLALLSFAGEWLGFSLFGERRIKIKESVLAARQAELEMRAQLTRDKKSEAPGA